MMSRTGQYQVTNITSQISPTIFALYICLVLVVAKEFHASQVDDERTDEADANISLTICLLLLLLLFVSSNA
jgi:hypothetical protein